MANHKSPAAQALKDMKELEMDVEFLEGNINRIHVLNIEIGIITKSKPKKREKKPKLIPVTRPKEIHNRITLNSNITFNSDGTVSTGLNIEWDWK